MSEEDLRMHTRRGFLALAAGALAAPAFAGSAVRLAKDRFVINALGGLGNPNDRTERPAPVIDPRGLADARASGLIAVNVTIGYISGPKDPFEQSVREIGQWDRLVREHSHDLLKVGSASDIERCQAEGKIGVIFGFQNAAMMGNDASRADIFADLGVKVIQLTYNPANQIGDGSMAPENRGLTPFGREVIARLNANRTMVDLSHSGEKTCLEATRISQQPVSINHTGCRALSDLPRNKSDEELRLVASKGGFIGIYFMPFLNVSGHPDADDVVAHIEHAVKICGEDHVGIGTDGDITEIDDLKAYEAILAKETAERSAAGISAAGERADTYPFVIDLRGPDQFRKLAGLLEKRGHSSKRIEKIMAGNFLRYAREVWD